VLSRELVVVVRSPEAPEATRGCVSVVGTLENDERFDAGLQGLDRSAAFSQGFSRGGCSGVVPFDTPPDRLAAGGR
jgi:hypothetical protein